MAKTLHLEVQRDHIDSLTRANGVNALCELIWNALDADATKVWIYSEKNELGSYSKLVVEDNGHGLPFNEALRVFSNLGGSEKRKHGYSPKHRAYHGKEGKGRYKTLALGDTASFESMVLTDKGDKIQKFTALIDKNRLSNPIVLEPEISEESESSGFKVTIHNPHDKQINQALSQSGLNEIRERLAIYNISYPDFSVYIGSKKIDFEELVKDKYEEEIFYNLSEDDVVRFTIKVINWRIECQKKLYLCGRHGISYFDKPIGIRTPLNISLFIESPYIDKLHADSQLGLPEMDEVLSEVTNIAKQIARKYSREQLHSRARSFIDELKKDNIYPYDHAPEGQVEIATRQVFDIVALQVNEFLPSFQEQDNKSKHFVLSLVKESLETNSDNLKRILKEVIGLPKSKQEELADILESTSLSSIIDTMKEITNRLHMLRALQHIIYDDELSKNIKERKHLHKIVVNETWIFGDDYTYGADDVSLKNVLKAHLKYLGREDFEEVINSEGNEELNKIPDVCLWRQFSRGRGGYFENLIVELKKPTVDAGQKEYFQITDYAARISNDSRFTKTHHKWTFILLVRDIKEEIERFCNPKDRKYGHVLSDEHFDVHIMKWSDVLDDTRTRYEYIKNKLNITLESNEECISTLRDKYRHYLPEEFPDVVV